MRGAVVAVFLLLTSGVARADVLGLVLDEIPAAGGGSGSGSAAPPSEPGDLIAWAGVSRPTTLPELLQVAIRQSPALQNATLDIAVADAQVRETWARHDWTVQAQLSGQRFGSTNLGGIQMTSSTTIGVTADVSRILPTGGTVDVHFGSQYEDFGFDAGSFSSIFPGSVWSDTLTGSITQPLLKGRGGTYYDATERKADLSRDATVLARRLAALQEVQNVISDYWDLVLAEQQVAITASSLAVANERLRVTEVEVESGRSAESEIPAVQQTIKTDEEQVLTGELAVLDASLALRRAVGMEMGPGDFGLRVATDLEALDRPLDLGQLIQRAYDASPELAELAKQDASAGIDVWVNDNGLLPQLDLALTVGPSGQEPGFVATARDTFELRTYEVIGSLTFSQSLHHYDVRNRSAELRNGRQKIRVNAVDVRAQLAQAMAHSVAAIELAERRVTIDDEAVALARQNVQIETDRFNAGRSTNFDIMLRLDEQRQAELRKVQAQIDWHKAETMMLMLTGDLLPMYGISVP